MKITRYITLAALVLSLASCNKEDQPQSSGRNIIFAMEEGLDGFSTKSVITDDNISSTTVKVYATKDNAAVANLSPGTIAKASTGFWKPTTAVEWDDNSNAGCAYAFTAYAYTTSGISDVDSDGLKFTVEEPTSYADPTKMADYTISETVTVSKAKALTHPLVQISLNHVLPAVEVYVTVDASITGGAYVTSLKLSGLYYSATLDYNEVSSKWIPTLIGERTSSYSLSSSAGMILTTDRTTTPAKISIISVPQQLNQKCLLEVTYAVNESLTATPAYKEYSETFVLSDYASELECGHRTVFHLNVDTGIHLTASIAQWKHVDFIEGTVLPAIK